MSAQAATGPDVERINRLQEEFRILHRLGLHLFPVGADKLPVGKWANGTVNYVQDRATIAQGDEWSRDKRVHGWANLCGNRNVKVFTFDVEAAGMDYPQITGVLDRLPSTCLRPSPSGGRHAVVQVTDGDPVETEALAYVGGVLLAETRGASPREGNNGAYAVITGPGRGDLPRTFEPARMPRTEVERLLGMVRAIDDGSRTAKPRTERPARTNAGTTSTGGGGTGEVLVEAIRSGALSWPDLLDDGWTVTSDWQGRLGLLRPAYGQASSAGESANAQDGVLVVHSEAVRWAEVGRGYNAPQALAAARFGDDYAAAMRAVEEGSKGSRPQFMAAWPEGVLDAVRGSQAADVAAWKARQAHAVEDYLDGHGTVGALLTGHKKGPGTMTEDRALHVVPEPEEDSGEAPPFVSSWSPLDLGAILDGSHVPEEPTLARRSDGAGLFYAGRTHSLYGESGSGKSLVVQSVAVEVMRAGGRVCYLDFESDAGSIVSRLRSLGATVEEIRAGLDYVRPDATLTATGDVDAYSGILSRSYVLVILDGVVEAMSLVLGDGRGTPEESVARFDRLLPGRLARMTGAAVVSVDHVTKSTESRGGNALGSGHKRAILTGAGFMVRAVTLPVVGKRGVVELRVTKDRPGGLRPRCGPLGAFNAQDAARFIFDATAGDGITRTTIEPPPVEDGGTAFRPTALMERASRALELEPEPLTANALAANIGGRKDAALSAIRILVEDGYLVATKGPRGAAMHSSARPYRQSDDPGSDRFIS